MFLIEVCLHLVNILFQELEELLEKLPKLEEILAKLQRLEEVLANLLM